MKTTRGLNAAKTEAREYQTGASGIFFTVKDVLYEGRSKFQRIEIIRNRDYGRVLLLDGLVQTTERDEFYYHEMLVHPAMASHPRPAKVLIIGGGDGGALREVLKHPVKKAWLVEIDGQVIEACREHFPWLRATFRDPRAELVVADGNVFIDKVRETFDVILVDSSDPVGPSTVLHQEAFYRKLKSKLNPGGIIAAQAGLAHAPPRFARPQERLPEEDLPALAALPRPRADLSGRHVVLQFPLGQGRPGQGQDALHPGRAALFQSRRLPGGLRPAEFPGRSWLKKAK